VIRAAVSTRRVKLNWTTHRHGLKSDLLKEIMSDEYNIK